MRLLGRSTVMEELKRGSKKNIENRALSLASVLMFNDSDRATLDMAVAYHKAKIKHLNAPIFSFPFKLGDPRKVSAKVWQHFENMKEMLKQYKINPDKFFDFTFVKQMDRLDNLTPWFIYSDQRINEYLKYQQTASTPEKKEKAKVLSFDVCNQLVKIYMAKRHCTEEQFWKECWMNNWISNFPLVYLRQHTLYKKLYAAGVFKEFETCPNPFASSLRRGVKIQ